VVYETDEEQLEAIKKWWKENGRSIIAGVVIGLGGLLGWRGWVSYHENQAKAASEHFNALYTAAERNDTKVVFQNSKVLKTSYSSTPYAALAALETAKLKAQEGDLDTAKVELQWAIDHSPQETVRNVATIRLARVLIDQQKYDMALDVLSNQLPSGYTALVEEVRGDAWVGKGETDKARAAYDRAIVSSGGNIEYLRMKRDDLGEEGDRSEASSS
jgi:predicted negative regulator of RcsB-dependent stress response